MQKLNFYCFSRFYGDQDKISSLLIVGLEFQIRFLEFRVKNPELQTIIRTYM